MFLLLYSGCCTHSPPAIKVTIASSFSYVSFCFFAIPFRNVVRLIPIPYCTAQNPWLILLFLSSSFLIFLNNESRFCFHIPFSLGHCCSPSNYSQIVSKIKFKLIFNGHSQCMYTSDTCVYVKEVSYLLATCIITCMQSMQHY